MRKLNNSDLKRQAVWLKVLCWLAVFFSPTICALLLATMIRLPPPPSAEPFIVVMLVVSLVVPPMVYGTMVSTLSVTQKWGVIVPPLTLLGMTVQFHVWVLIILFPEAAAGILKHLKGA